MIKYVTKVLSTIKIIDNSLVVYLCAISVKTIKNKEYPKTR
ncbi:hypothetical protein MNB_ARC-1_1096 [hydrothermal vent metagenome]|uniref:Uncharacterized protein n=1 Tax=hydrothermal vent metagenome TaxID=652676 RepID=A0A3B1E5S1_9ZZZZ